MREIRDLLGNSSRGDLALWSFSLRATKKHADIKESILVGKNSKKFIILFM